MQVKLFEVRDRSTFIPVMATKVAAANERQADLLAAAGYGREQRYGDYVILTQINGGRGQSFCDPYDWTAGRTMKVAHQFIHDNFERIEDGFVVDVEFILGETKEPKTAEAIVHGVNVPD